MSKKHLEKLAEEVLISEASLVGLFWNSPDLYGLYNDRLTAASFANPIWKFYYALGQQLYQKRLTVYDDISTQQMVNELRCADKYEEYNGYRTISEVMEETKGLKENLESYYGEVKKHSILRKLVKLLGEKVLLESDRYDYKRMTAEQITTYWLDKVNQISLENDNPFEEGYLLSGLRESVQEWNTNPSIGLPFYNSPKLTKATTGWEHGHVYLHGGFGGKGKTSFTMNKVVMSCIEHQEKLLIIANEQSIDEFKKLLLVTAMGTGTRQAIQRQRLQEGNFSGDETGKLETALEWLDGLITDEKLIAIVFMENYTMDNVKKVLTYYAHRGYRRVIIDTGKPGDNAASMARWERFAEDMKDLYKMTRPNGGGLNLAVWINVQLADAARGQRFLNEFALGDSKKIKNEASVLFLSRPLFDDEYEGGSKEIRCYNWKKNPIEEDKFVQEHFTLPKFELDEGGNVKHQNIYYLLFTAKNRRGQSNDTGLDVLVLKVNLNSNTWYEVGWCSLVNNNNY